MCVSPEQAACRLAVADAENRSVLVGINSSGRRRTMVFGFAEVEADVVVHQAQQGGDGWADQRVVRRLADSLVESDVGCRARSGAHRQQGLIAAKACSGAAQVGVGGAFGGPFRRAHQRFEHAAELNMSSRRFW